MASLLKRNVDFRRLWVSGLVSQAGDWLSYVAVSLLAMEHGAGEGALALAMVFAAHSLPHAVLAPVSGLLADRWDRRRLLMATHVLSALLTLVMLWMASRGHLAGLQVALVLRTAVAAFGTPAETAAVKGLVQAEDLVRANAVQAASWSVMFAVGMALGGVLASLGPEVALAADALTFVVAAAVLWPLPAMRPEPSPVRSRGGFSAPLAALRADTQLVRAVFAKLPLSLSGGAAWVVLNLVTHELAFFGTAALTLGLVQAVKGVGTGVGPLLASRGKPSDRTWMLSGFFTIGAMGVFAVSREPVLLVVASLVWGLGAGTNWVLSSAQLQLRAPDHAVGRLASLDVFAMTGAQAVSAVAAALLIEAGLSPVALVLAPAVLWAALWVSPRLAVAATR